MPLAPRLTSGPAVLAALLLLAAGCAGGPLRASGGGATDRSATPAAGLPARPPEGFAPGDLPEQLAREAALRAALDPAAGARALAVAAGRGGSGNDADPLPAASAALLAAFEAAGLDAGAWRFATPGPGVNVMARIEGSDRPMEIVLLSAPYRPTGGGAVSRDDAGAVLAAAAEGLGALVAAGWQPRRTVMLAAWDGAAAAPDGARAWLEQGPVDVPGSTLVALTAVPRRSAEPGASPALRPLAASILSPDAAVGDPAGRGEAGLLLSRGVPVIEVPVAPAAAGEQVAAAAATLAVLAVRAADAALPFLSPAAAAQRALAASRELDDAARAAFADNPPPLRELRLALLEMRDAGEAWSRAGDTALARLGTVPRGPAGAATRARLEAAVAAGRAAIRLADATPRAPGACASLIICPDDAGGPARLLPGFEQAVAAGDREALVARALVLAAAARESALRLQQAADMLNATPEDAP